MFQKVVKDLMAHVTRNFNLQVRAYLWANNFKFADYLQPHRVFISSS